MGWKRRAILFELKGLEPARPCFDKYLFLGGEEVTIKEIMRFLEIIHP